ncbi:hypothetical protein CVD28_00685 [Bacillus sp. M6-12]|uniref:hypothetical protein n=1 Tax=Bacillus sp. M6-12 TaxID=2054166 RepID=UPI000C784D09|nr:hypothetical protein [Bacillus sp. M6-12]PLS18949.1 hypothetical protein CVD28_00685 [Bacillus sp. M6-12]
MIIALDGFKKKEVRLCNDSRYLNTLVLGQKGTGKSDHVLLNMYYQDLKDKDHSIFVFTSKGDTSYKLYTLAKHMGRKVHLIKPETNSFNINLLKGEEQEVTEYMTELFSHVFKGMDMFFQEMNKTLLVYGIKVVKRTLGEHATIEDLWDVMENINGLGRKRVLEFSRLKPEDVCMAKENGNIASWFLNEYFVEKKEYRVYEYCSAIRMKIRELVDFQNNYNFSPEEEDLPDFKKVLKNHEVVIVDTEFLTYKDYASLMGSYLLMKIQQELLQADSADSFMYLDDFQKYYPVLTELLEGSHIKNVGIMLFLQEMSQLNIYPEYKHVIQNSVSNLILLERISYEDYLFYKTYMNAELLNRKRGEIVYKLINREGTSESTNGTLYANEKLLLQYEKFLDYKKNLTKKKKKRTSTKKVEEVVEEKQVEAPIELEKEVEQEVGEKIEEKAEMFEINLPESLLKVEPSSPKRTFSQIKREGDGKEYLSPTELFNEDEENE